MSNIYKYLSALLLVLSWLSFFFLGYKMGEKSENRTVKIDTTYVEVNHVAPTPSEERNVDVISVPFKISTANPQEPAIPRTEIDVINPATLDSLFRATCDTTISVDTVRKEVMIPITQKEYRDSDYTAYVSGFHAKLDSIEVRTKEVTYTKTETKFRRWNIGLTGGYGYGFRSKQFEPFVGIGITLNIFR